MTRKRLPKPECIYGCPKTGEKWYAAIQQLGPQPNFRKAYTVFALFRSRKSAKEYVDQWSDCKTIRVVVIDPKMPTLEETNFPKNFYEEFCKDHMPHHIALDE